MKNFIRDNKLVWLLKIVFALYQFPATLMVFHDITRDAGRSQFFAWFSAFLAVLLIDMMYLVSLYLLESHELNPAQKLPWSVSAILLTAAIIVIGVQDEGVTAWMPRITVVALTATATLSLLTEYITWFRDIDRQIERSNREREKDEIKLRNREVKLRKDKMYAAYEEALTSLHDELVDLHINRERVKLGMVDKNEEYGEVEATEFQGVFKLPDGSYAWKNGTDELHVASKLGKPYTSAHGANIARKRALS